MTPPKLDQEFLLLLQQSLQEASFVKLTLGAYKGSDTTLKTIEARKILVKRQEKLSFTSHYKTRDIVKNYAFDESIALVETALKDGFCTATLFTTRADSRLEMRFGKPPSLQQHAPSHSTVPPLAHDRQKQRLVDAKDASYLQALKITDAKGNVFPAAQDKFRQINKYIEILSGLIKQLPSHESLRVVDMGAGKGYLTFALYDYLTRTLGVKAEVTGVEYRQELVDLCNDIAQNAGFSGLRFVQGSIEQYDCSSAHMVIALHACDTATDDAIAAAIRAQAELIVVAPCCHKQVRSEMQQSQAKNDLAFLTKHGTFLERQAEMVTDGMRAQIMEYFGYRTKLFEFISDAHTPKNVMIVGIRNQAVAQRSPAMLAAISAAKHYFGIRQHALEAALGM